MTERNVRLEGYVDDQKLTASLRASIKEKRWSVDAGVTATKYAAAAGIGAAVTVAISYLW
jgi:hypothetical protein